MRCDAQYVTLMMNGPGEEAEEEKKVDKGKQKKKKHSRAGLSSAEKRLSTTPETSNFSK